MLEMCHVVKCIFFSRFQDSKLSDRILRFDIANTKLAIEPTPQFGVCAQSMCSVRIGVT